MIRIILLILLSACGYRFGSPALSSQYRTFHVAYAKGDIKGLFTNVLIEKMASSTPFYYTNECPDLEIKVCLSAPSQRNIGFVYAPRDPKVTTAHEGRLTQEATLTIIDCKTKRVVLPTTSISAWLDYDFEPDMGTVNRQVFALGQLEMNPLAKDTAAPALYALLAEKIVDYVKNSW